MNTDFPRVLSLLRKEKGLSQRAVSEQLGISQALLSHYENGIREPGLDFVVKACGFYGVSADYLLGRTMSRDGTAINVDELYDVAEQKENNLKNVSVFALLNKKLLVNACSIVIDLLGRMGSKDAVRYAADYLGAAIYKLFRHIYMYAGIKPEEFFSVESSCFSEAVDADMKLSEMRFKNALRFPAQKPEAKPFVLSNDSLAQDYPLLFQSLLSVLHSTGERIGKQL